MKPTQDQNNVIELDSGYHLVLAPPGSGKTEMLSQRILRALNRGIAPQRMLCATFTNRAAFEMRERISHEAPKSTSLPEVGNLHHFCHNFLRSIGRLAPTKHVLDDVEQRSFIKEIVDVLRKELSADTLPIRETRHGIAVLRRIKGVFDPTVGTIHELRQDHLRGLLEEWFASCQKKEISPYSSILSAVLISHQRKIGIPTRYLRKTPPEMLTFDAEGIIRAIEQSYSALKRSFNSLDFDDLINETYLFLAQNSLDESRRYHWVQIDEVQDLNPLQWFIVRNVTSAAAVSVYFGDLEQAIFGFLGASESHFADATRDCMRHYFRTNFRTTPLLLELLMRYSLTTLRSEWDFLPEPSDINRADGEIRMSDSSKTSHVLAQMQNWLDCRKAENVALLVRTNVAADTLEGPIRRLGYRTVKVSGIDLFAYAPMRDFLAFLALLNETIMRTEWARLIRRFMPEIHTSADARYFVREMFAARFNPLLLFTNHPIIPKLPWPRTRASQWAWRNRKRLLAFRKALFPALKHWRTRLNGTQQFRNVFTSLIPLTIQDSSRYTLRELWPERGGPRDETSRDDRHLASQHASERLEIFLRYVDHIYKDDSRTFEQILREDKMLLSKLKEADLLIDDEQVILSTIHKAKGRQFDAVIVPNVAETLNTPGTDSEENRRLLYVAMSRTKRHLALFGCKDVSDTLTDIRPCFESKLPNYYQRKYNQADLSTDWLCQWEQLAAYNRNGQFNDAVLSLLLPNSTTGTPAIEGNHACLRMALKTLQHLQDTTRRQSLFLQLMQPHVLPTDCLATLFYCIRQCRCFAAELLDAAHVRIFNVDDKSVRHSALNYFAEAGSAAHLTDFLYLSDPDLRVEAARHLFESGDSRWINIVTGTHKDFERLALISEPRHEPTIRSLITVAEQKRNNTYAHALRLIIYKRATRNV